MSNWFLFQEIGFYLFLFLAFYFVVKRQHVNLLALYFWGTAFACCYKYAVTLWTPEKIISLSMIWCMLFHTPKRRFAYLPALVRIVSVFIALIIVSDVVAIITPPKFHVAVSPIQRLVLQNFAYISYAVLLFFGILLPKGFIRDFYPKYCRAVEFGIIGGTIQYICIQFDIPFMPILRTGGVVNEMNTVLGEFGGEIMLRVYGFAGEPKGLGFLIVPYLVVSIVNYVRGTIRENTLFHLSFMFLGGFILFVTLSSSAFISFFLMIPIILLFTNVRLVVNGKVQGITVVLIMLFFSSLWIVGVKAISPSERTFWDDINDRTFRRGQTELSEGRQESIIFDYYRKEDIATQVCGWGIGQYTFHVPDQVTSEGQLIPVQSGILLTLTDFGCVGLLLYLGIILSAFNLVIKCRKLKESLPLAFSMATISKLTESFMHGSIITCFVFLMIASYSFEDSRNV